MCDPKATTTLIYHRELDPRKIRGFSFYGEPGAGKSTAAIHMIETFAMTWVAFATALRLELAEALYPLDPYAKDAFMHASRDPATKDKYIPLLQAWGAFRRSEDPDHWVRIARAHVHAAAIHVVLDDARYDNEKVMLDEQGVLSVWVDGPARKFKPDHESEWDWKHWKPDITIVNRGSKATYADDLDDLYRMCFLTR